MAFCPVDRPYQTAKAGCGERTGPVKGGATHGARAIDGVRIIIKLDTEQFAGSAQYNFMDQGNCCSSCQSSLSLPGGFDVMHRSSFRSVALHFWRAVKSHTRSYELDSGIY
jgi:hypothetical protein